MNVIVKSTMVGPVSSRILAERVFGISSISDMVVNCLFQDDAKVEKDFEGQLHVFWNRYNWNDFERLRRVPKMLSGTGEQQEDAVAFIKFVQSNLQKWYFSDPFVDDVMWYLSKADEHTKTWAIKFINRAIILE